MPLHPESMRELRALVRLHGGRAILLALAEIHAEDVSKQKAIKPQSAARETYERAWSVKNSLR